MTTIRILCGIALLVTLGCKCQDSDSPSSNSSNLVNRAKSACDSVVTDYTVRLKALEFPTGLDGDAKFRMVVDLRLIDPNGEFKETSAVLPGLESFWNCHNGDDDWTYVGEKVNSYVSRLDIDKIGVWDTHIFRVRAQRLMAIRIRLYDAKGKGWWQRFGDVWKAIPSAFLGQYTGAVEAGVSSMLSLGDNEVKLLFQNSIALDKNMELSSKKYTFTGQGEKDTYCIEVIVAGNGS